MATRGLFISFEGIDGSGKSTQARLLAEHLRGRGHDVRLTREPGGSPGAEEIRRLLVEGSPARWSGETEVLLFTAARRDHLERTIRPALGEGAIVISDRFADSTRVYQGAATDGLRAPETDASAMPGRPADSTQPGAASGGLRAAGMGASVVPDRPADSTQPGATSGGLRAAGLGASVVPDRLADATRPGAARGGLRALVDRLHDDLIGLEPDLTFILDMDANAALRRGLARRSGEDRFEEMGAAFQSRLRDGFRALAQEFPARCRLIDASRTENEIALEIAAAMEGLTA